MLTEAGVVSSGITFVPDFWLVYSIVEKGARTHTHASIQYMKRRVAFDKKPANQNRRNRVAFSV